MKNNKRNEQSLIFYYAGIFTVLCTIALIAAACVISSKKDKMVEAQPKYTYVQTISNSELAKYDVDTNSLGLSAEQLVLANIVSRSVIYTGDKEKDTYNENMVIQCAYNCIHSSLYPDTYTELCNTIQWSAGIPSSGNTLESAAKAVYNFYNQPNMDENSYTSFYYTESNEMIYA